MANKCLLLLHINCPIFDSEVQLHQNIIHLLWIVQLFNETCKKQGSTVIFDHILLQGIECTYHAKIIDL